MTQKKNGQKKSGQAVEKKEGVTIYRYHGQVFEVPSAYSHQQVRTHWAQTYPELGQCDLKEIGPDEFEFVKRVTTKGDWHTAVAEVERVLAQNPLEVSGELAVGQRTFADVWENGKEFEIKLASYGQPAPSDEFVHDYFGRVMLARPEPATQFLACPAW